MFEAESHLKHVFQSQMSNLRDHIKNFKQPVPTVHGAEEASAAFVAFGSKKSSFCCCT